MPVDKSIVSKNELHTVTSQLKRDKLDIIKKVQMLDLEPIAFLLTHPKKNIRWTREKTIQAIAHYKMFLLLHYFYPDKNIVPTVDIDIVWEHHFSDSAKYRQDCQMLFGQFLDHNPYFGILDENDEKNWLAAFAETKILFEQNFGSDFLATVNLEFKNPARCEPLKQPKQIRRPRRANIQAEVRDIFAGNLIKCG